MRLRDIFTAISRRRPLLLILEDLHWADDLSLDLISLLMKVSARKHFELGLKELPEDDKSVQRVRLEHDIAWAWGLDSVLDKLHCCQQAAKIAEEMGYRRELAILCASIEKWQSFGGNYSDEYGEKAKTVAEELDDIPTLARVYWVMGNTRLYGRMGRHWTQQSIPYYLHAVEISERIDDVQIQTMSLVWLGQAYRELGQNEKAIESWEKTLAIAAGTKSIFPLIKASGIMGIYGERGQEDMVISTFSRIMRSFAELSIDEEFQAWSLIMGHSINDCQVKNENNSRIAVLKEFSKRVALMASWNRALENFTG